MWQVVATLLQVCCTWLVLLNFWLYIFSGWKIMAKFHREMNLNQYHYFINTTTSSIPLTHQLTTSSKSLHYQYHYLINTTLSSTPLLHQHQYLINTTVSSISLLHQHHYFPPIRVRTSSSWFSSKPPHSPHFSHLTDCCTPGWGGWWSGGNWQITSCGGICVVTCPYLFWPYSFDFLSSYRFVFV